MKKIVGISVALSVALMVAFIAISIALETNEPEYYERYGFQPTVVVNGDWKPTKEEVLKAGKMIVKGDADLSGCESKLIPEYLWVDGDLYVNSLTETIPDTIHVGGKLILQGSRVKTLPQYLDVRNVDLDGTEVDEIPGDFHLTGSISFGGSRVTSIPDGWVIECMIDATNSNIESIGEHNNYYDTGSPNTMGMILLDGSKVKSLPKNLHLIVLSIGNAPIEVLPEGLILEEGLDLRGTCVRKLSERTEIHETLDLTGTAISELPPDIKIHRKLIITDTAIEIEDVPNGAVWSNDIVK